MEQIKELLTDLFRYHDIVALRFIDLFESENTMPAKALLLQSHLLNSQHIWNSRILKEKPVYSPWDLHPAGNLRSMHLDNAALTQKILGAAGLTDTVTYTNTTGKTYTGTVQDILMQVSNHNTYHRGQINQLLRAEGLTPPVIDYIAWKRGDF